MNSWFRSHHGAPTDPKWIVIAARAGTRPGVVAALWWALLDHASQSQPRGSVRTVDLETLAAFYGWPEPELRAVLDVFRERGMIGEDDRLSRWSKRNPKRERERPDLSAERVRRHRNAKQNHVTPSNASNAHVTPVTPQIEVKEKEKPPSEGKRKRKAETSKSLLPAVWQPNEAHAAKAAKHDLDLPDELERFRNHHTANGSRFFSWDAAFHTWLGNSVRFKNERAPPKNGGKQAFMSKEARETLYGKPKPTGW